MWELFLLLCIIGGAAQLFLNLSLLFSIFFFPTAAFIAFGPGELYFFYRQIISPEFWTFLGYYNGYHIQTISSRIYFQKTSSHMLPWDLVYISRHSTHYKLFFLLLWKTFIIHLHHVPPSHKLIYVDYEGREHEIMYEKGTPFRVEKGNLHLRKKIMKNRSVVMETVSQGVEWPHT